MCFRFWFDEVLMGYIQCLFLHSVCTSSHLILRRLLGDLVYHGCMNAEGSTYGRI